jgi:glycosyltransferase involved in cell wall biosynthesis
LERPLKIAQIAPLYESVPPKLYGGTERVVSYLTEALVNLGHDVTLFASGDSRTKAKLRSMCRQALRLDESSIDANADHVLLAEKVFQGSGEFDIVHSHIDYVPFSLLRRMATPHATTLHGRLDVPNLQNLYREFKDEPVISISNRQREPLPWANWQATVYHGVPAEFYAYHETPGKYLAFIGRISPEKRVEDAIEVARQTGLTLKIAAKVDKVDSDYFKEVIKPLLHSGVEFIGEIGEHEKSDFLGNALALLFMIDWPEPFGLAMIESLACGTPVIARARGSVPEVIEHGTTGIIVETVAEAQKAVGEIQRLSRKKCREIFEQRFSAVRMAQNYESVYMDLIRKAARKPADNLARAA